MEHCFPCFMLHGNLVNLYRSSGLFIFAWILHHDHYLTIIIQIPISQIWLWKLDIWYPIEFLVRNKRTEWNHCKNSRMMRLFLQIWQEPPLWSFSSSVLSFPFRIFSKMFLPNRLKTPLNIRKIGSNKPDYWQKMSKFEQINK